MIGETIDSVEEHHDNQWLVLKMKSRRAFKIEVHGYYGGDADLSWEKDCSGPGNAELRQHLRDKNALQPTEAQMSDFQHMDAAPKDGTIVKLKTHSGHEFLASYQSGFMDEDENDCYCWVAEENEVLRLEDAETGEQRLIDTASKQGREEFRQHAKQLEELLSSEFKKRKIDHVNVATHEDYTLPLRLLFKKREKKR